MLNLRVNEFEKGGTLEFTKLSRHFHPHLPPLIHLQSLRHHRIPLRRPLVRPQHLGFLLSIFCKLPDLISHRRDLLIRMRRSRPRTSPLLFSY